MLWSGGGEEERVLRSLTWAMAWYPVRQRIVRKSKGNSLDNRFWRIVLSFFEPVLPLTGSGMPVLAVHQDGDGPVVGEAELHVGTKTAGPDFQTVFLL